MHLGTRRLPNFFLSLIAFFSSCTPSSLFYPSLGESTSKKHGREGDGDGGAERRAAGRDALEGGADGAVLVSSCVDGQERREQRVWGSLLLQLHRL